MSRSGFLIIFVLFLTVLVSGCATVKRTGTETPRSATEQLLLSTAAERSATRIEGPDLLGVPIYLEVTGFTKDADFAKETVASELLARGAIVVTDATKATYTVKIFYTMLHYSPVACCEILSEIVVADNKFASCGD